MVTEYKVVETSIVTDESLEEIINNFVQQGWQFDGVQFAMRDASKRPAMAFVMFTRTVPDSCEEEHLEAKKHGRKK
jgi:hypothetical protein